MKSELTMTHGSRRPERGRLSTPAVRSAAAGRVAAWLLAAILGLGGAAEAQLNSGPMIRLAERTWDFGVIDQAGHFTHKFRLSNSGTAELAIKKLESSCGCTAALASDSLIAPGESTEIELTFSSKDFEGPQTKFVAVYTNDPAEPRLDLVLKAFVRPFVRVTERQLDFTEVRRGDPGLVSTVLKAEKGSGFKVTKVEGGEEYVDWKIVPMTAPDSLAFRIEGRVKPTAPLGRFNQRIAVTLVHPHRETESFAVRGHVYSYFRPEKYTINFNTVKSGKDQERALELVADGSKPYRLLDAIPSAPYLTARIEPLGTGYKLVVLLDVPDTVGSFKDTVTVKTTDPDEPEIQIAVNSKIRP